MIINKPGSVNFWFDPSKNPNAFKDGINIRWKEFELNREHVIITSEGTSLNVIMNPQKDRELIVFQTGIEPDPTKRHMVTVTWTPEQVCLYLDAQVQQEIHPSDLYG